MAYAALAVGGLLIGLLTGWFGHRRVLTWCVRCTQPVGNVCVDCRNMERASNRRQIGYREAA
jgi:hypothetical protein